MPRKTRLILALIALFTIFSSPARAEILAMLNYESKPEQTIRREGLAVIDVDLEYSVIELRQNTHGYPTAA